MPAFSRLLPVAGLTYGLQLALAAIAVPLQTEKFYDAGGALGWLTTAAASLYGPTLKARYWNNTPAPFPALSNFAPRQLILSACVGLWTARLGTFLIQRIMKAGSDSRFDEVKKEPAKFTFFWVAQGTWIFLVGLPVWMANTMPAALHPALTPRDYISLGLFAGCLAFETIADLQKTRWRETKDKSRHDEKFITSGLWSLSRHPNYVGEIGVWTSILLLSSTALQTPYFPAYVLPLAAISPIMTWFLLSKVSGVPPLEKSAEKKWGKDPKWQQYKKNTPVLFPWGTKG